jgi:predicted dehydrogenase
VADHARHARLALSAGCHVHLEKPPAVDLAEFTALQQLAASRGRLLQMGYMWRHNPGLEVALNTARQGWLGQVWMVRATMNTRVDAAERRLWARFPGGAMFEQGSHLIDAVVRLLGRPVKVTPFLRKDGGAGDGLADNTVAVLEFERAMAVIASAPLQPNAGPQRCFEICGTEGTARLQPIEPPALTIDLARPAGKFAAGRNDVTLAGYRRYVDDFKEIAHAIRVGRPLAVTPETDAWVHETVLRAAGMS